MKFERQIHKTNFTNTISKITQKSNVRSRTLNVEPRWSDHPKKNIPPKSSLLITRAIDFLGRCFWRSFFQTPFVKFVFCSSSFEFPKSTLHIWCLRFERTLKKWFSLSGIQFLKSVFEFDSLGSSCNISSAKFCISRISYWYRSLNVYVWNEVFRVWAITSRSPSFELDVFAFEAQRLKFETDSSFSDSSSVSFQQDVMLEIRHSLLIFGQNAREHLLHSNVL